MTNLPNFVKVSFKGQATLLAILIATAVAVVTAVGVTTRQNSSFRRTTYTTQTDQSFSCANSGVDAALLCITNGEKAGDSKSTIISDCTKSNIPVTEGNCSYSTVLTDLTTNFTLNPITPGQVQQVLTNNATSITLTWKDGDSDTKMPSLEVTYAYYNNGTSTYEMKKFAYGCNTISLGGTVDISGFSTSTYTAGTKSCSQNVDLTPARAESLVRIKPLFSSASIKVDITGGSNSQGYKINASGKAGDAVRNIEVLRMNPQLPALFDYVLYSEEGSISK